MPLKVAMLLECPCCGSAVSRFDPIPDAYVDECRARDVEHPLDAWETLNLKAYLCPSCGATDRDRLQVVFLRGLLARPPDVLGPLRGPQVESSAADPGCRSAQPGATIHDPFGIGAAVGDDASCGGAGSDQGTLRRCLRVLEVAPSGTVSAWLRAQHGVVLRTCDLDRTDVDDRADLTDLPYPEATFDLVLCSHVLEHVPNDLAAMGEIRRVLKTDGTALLLVPISQLVEGVLEDPSVSGEAERWRRFGQGDHVRIYGRAGFLNRLEESGLGVELFHPESSRWGLTPGNTLYVGRPG